MASAAAAKKWPRPSQALLVCSPPSPQGTPHGPGRSLQGLAGLFVGQLLAASCAARRRRAAKVVSAARVALFDRGSEFA